MALSIIRLVDRRNGKLRFACDIGTNHFFALRLGTENDIVLDGGLPRIRSLYNQTSIRELPPQMLGRFKLSVSENSFPKNKEYVQLLSYKDKDGFGSAWSDILKIHR